MGYNAITVRPLAESLQSEGELVSRASRSTLPSGLVSPTLFPCDTLPNDLECISRVSEVTLLKLLKLTNGPLPQHVDQAERIRELYYPESGW